MSFITSSIKHYTISQLKNIDDVTALQYKFILISDDGRESIYEYVPNDNSVGDDINIIVTNSGKRYFRRTESISNKSSDIQLGNSDLLYPTQRAVKEYVDNFNDFTWKIFNGFTINEMRQITDLQLQNVNRFYCKEIDNAYFIYDSNDTNSVDDGNLVIVTSTNKRLKRETSFVNMYFNSNQIE